MLIFPSRGPESLSRVLIEASALGVPIAAMDTGGTRDIVEHDVTGLLSTIARRARGRRAPARGRRRASRAALGDAAQRARSSASSTRRPSSRAIERLYRGARTRRDEASRCVARARSFPLHGSAASSGTSTISSARWPTRGVEVTLDHPAADRGTRTWSPRLDPSRACACEFVPYRTFPGAGRRGTTVLDRSTAYPLFGLRAGRTALDLVRQGRVDIVHGLGASVLGYARYGGAGAATAPLVLNPQGLEEFGATDPSRAPLKRAAYLPLRRAVLHLRAPRPTR